jgi:fructose-1,6-bisphosphatase
MEGCWRQQDDREWSGDTAALCQREAAVQLLDCVVSGAVVEAIADPSRSMCTPYCRYTGGMVPDVFQIIVKEKGVFTNVTSPSTKAKLRILFEVAPLALMVEQVGVVLILLFSFFN